LKNIQQKNKMTILLISHDLGLMAEVADEMVVLYKGTIVEKGNAKKILQQPAHAYTKALLLCKPHAGSKGKKLTVLSDLLESTQPIIKENLPFHSKNNPLNDEVPLLSVQSVKVYFPAATNFWGAPTKFYKALDDVSFDVFANETIGIVGESGCGKTTLGRTILQLTKAIEGKILLNGTDLCATNKKNISKQLQMVFQDPYGSLNPTLTIGDAITEPMKVHQLFGNKKERKEKAIHLLEQVNLKPDFFNRYPHQFSGGQRQRICIARALALEPSFLIFDESVSALDLSVQAQVLNLINDLKASYQFTSLFISHDLSVVHYISDRILVMRQGKIIEQGQADEVFYAPKNEYTRQLIEAIPGKNK